MANERINYFVHFPPLEPHWSPFGAPEPSVLPNLPAAPFYEVVFDIVDPTFVSETRNEIPKPGKYDPCFRLTCQRNLPKLPNTSPIQAAGMFGVGILAWQLLQWPNMSYDRNKFGRETETWKLFWLKPIEINKCSGWNHSNRTRSGWKRWRSSDHLLHTCVRPVRYLFGTY